MAKKQRRAPAAAPDRVISYIRVSTLDQANEGVSLAAQRAKLEAWCVMQGAVLVRVEVDAGVSAKTLERPGLARALAALAAGEADALLVAKLDRLTRSVRDLDTLLTEHFGDDGADLVSIGESIDTRSAAGRLVLNVLASISQWEREACGERTATALAHLRDRGVHVGRDGLGWTRGAECDESGRRVIVEVQDEIALVQRIKRMRRRGATFETIAQTLNAEGVPTKRGGAKWWATTVRNVLVRPVVVPTRGAA